MRSDNSGVSERLFQEGVQYFVNHPDKWISRRELQEALGIKKTQACRLCDMLTVRLYLTPREQKADNSPLYLMLESEHMKSATKELASISTLTEDDRRLFACGLASSRPGCWRSSIISWVMRELNPTAICPVNSPTVRAYW